MYVKVNALGQYKLDLVVRGKWHENESTSIFQKFQYHISLQQLYLLLCPKDCNGQRVSPTRTKKKVSAGLLVGVVIAGALVTHGAVALSVVACKCFQCEHAELPEVQESSNIEGHFIHPDRSYRKLSAELEKQGRLSHPNIMMPLAHVLQTDCATKNSPPENSLAFLAAYFSKTGNLRKGIRLRIIPLDRKILFLCKMAGRFCTKYKRAFFNTSKRIHLRSMNQFKESKDFFVNNLIFSGMVENTDGGKNLEETFYALSMAYGARVNKPNLHVRNKGIEDSLILLAHRKCKSVQKRRSRPRVQDEMRNDGGRWEPFNFVL
eukprot:Gb_39857 [translate_table: standard]